MPNHMQSRASMVVKGTAPEECSPQMKKLRKKPIPNAMLGYNEAVCGGGRGEGGGVKTVMKVVGEEEGKREKEKERKKIETRKHDD